MSVELPHLRPVRAHPVDDVRAGVGETAETRLARVQRRLGALAIGDVMEQQSDPPRPGDLKGMDRPPATERRREILESLGLAGQRHTAVNVEPKLVMSGGYFAHPAPGGIFDPRLTLERRAHLQEAVIERLFVLIERDLDRAEAEVA